MKKIRLADGLHWDHLRVVGGGACGRYIISSMMMMMKMMMRMMRMMGMRMRMRMRVMMMIQTIAYDSIKNYDSNINQACD